MPGKLLHECGDDCACPVHGTPLIYWPAGDDHACQYPSCEYGHGGMREVLAAPDPGGTIARRIGIRRRDPAEAAELIHSGYAAAGIPPDVAEAMIEETLKQ